MRKRKKIWKILRNTFAVLGLLILSFVIYLYVVAIAHPPEISDQTSLKFQRDTVGKDAYKIKNNWFRKSHTGLYEMYVEGSSFEIGVVNGKLSQELVRKQEDYFSEQIFKMVPSENYRNFLKYFIGWFNRDLEDNVLPEYREEIYGVSESASDRYNYIGSNYQRILNYHAAHDIGHTLQNLALVGCTSFGTWNSRSQDSSMIIGRNFDFYVSDKFAEDKIIAFINPEKGYSFMSVTWGGFIGVVSGMNEKGLTVTINAAKSEIPSGSATPVSLVTREILQYAQNIEEAVAIARKRKMFVSESFLVASAEDKKAVVIEKTPTSIDVYDSNEDYIICTNHFQSNGLKKSKDNLSQVNESASSYRFQRMKQLLERKKENTVEATVDILRDRGGLNNRNIGMGNEKAVNQMIAHHSIVFEPEKLRVWVSTAPWQLGEFVAYDLRKIFNLKQVSATGEIYEPDLIIPKDSFLLSEQFLQFKKFRRLRQLAFEKQGINADSIINSNPELYLSYVIAADQQFENNQFKPALENYRSALLKVIATKKEEQHIRNRIKECIQKLK